MKTINFDDRDLAIIAVLLIAVGVAVPHLLKGGTITDMTDLLNSCLLVIGTLATGKKTKNAGQ